MLSVTVVLFNVKHALIEITVALFFVSIYNFPAFKIISNKGGYKVRSKKIDKKSAKLYKKLLLDKREELLGDISHISEETLKKSQKDASGDISGYTFHMADVATDNYDREFSLGLASKERSVLYEINHALHKLEEGGFGSCESCKKPISKIRLKAVPYAALCLKCQQAREKKF